MFTIMICNSKHSSHLMRPFERQSNDWICLLFCNDVYICISYLSMTLSAKVWWSISYLQSSQTHTHLHMVNPVKAYTHKVLSTLSTLRFHCPFLTSDLWGKLWPLVAKLYPRGEVVPQGWILYPRGDVITWGWNSVRPSILLNTR
jgi:hypothetical protein